MSLFRTLQREPRIITLFTHDLEGRVTSSILQSLKSDTSNKFNLEISTKFPTLDQLVYMNSVNPTVLKEQVPSLNNLLKLKSFDSIFGSPLQQCVASKNWNLKHPIWIDWERRFMGNSLKSIDSILKN